jgi:hypothetical protein
MTGVTLWECLLLLAFWLGGLAAFLIGGMVWLGYVTEGFLWAGFVWAARRIFLEVKEEVLKEIERSKAFSRWAKRRRAD